jgi:hypothetical protein
MDGATHPTFETCGDTKAIHGPADFLESIRWMPDRFHSSVSFRTPM